NLHEGDFILRDFRFQSGETLPELRVHYTTLGTVRKNPGGNIANAGILLHGTMDTGKSWLAPNIANELFGEGQPLDVRKTFIILPDSIGRGGSSKPSDGLRGNFPHYGYGDIVEAYQRLLTEGLG